MGNSNKKMEYAFLNYHCRKCKEIPLINFSEYDFDLFCPSHKILIYILKNFIILLFLIMNVLNVKFRLLIVIIIFIVINVIQYIVKNV